MRKVVLPLDSVQKFLYIVLAVAYNTTGELAMPHPTLGSEKMKIVGFHLGPEDMRRLDAVGSAKGMTRSAVVRYAIEMAYTVVNLPDSAQALTVRAAEAARAASAAGLAAAAAAEAAAAAVQQHIEHSR